MDGVFPVSLAFLSPGEWGIVLLLVVLLFGAAKIPELARSLGRAKGEFERGARDAPTQPLGASSTDPAAADEDAKVLDAARALGIPTEGRPVADVKRDLKAKMG